MNPNAPGTVASVVEFHTGCDGPSTMKYQAITFITSHIPRLKTENLDAVLDDAVDQGLLEKRSNGYVSARQVNDVVPGTTIGEELEVVTLLHTLF